MSRFLEHLAENRVVVGDGGTGALLTTLVPRLRCPEEANLKSPESVIAVHTGFIRAGAELIETNTFGANRRKLSAQFLDDQLEQIVERGVKLAREAREVSGAPVLIGGSIGPLGDLEHSTGAEDAFAVFHEQARLLEGRGVDLFLVETFYDLDELETAIRAVQDVSSLPIVAQLTFDEDAQTLAGVHAHDAVARLTALGVVAVGANCGLGPQAALAALAEMSETANGLPLTAQPNVGLPGPLGRPASSTRTRRPTTSRSSRPRRGASAPASSAAAAGRRRPRSARSAPRSRRAASRASPFTSSSATSSRPRSPAATATRLQTRLEAGEWVVSVELDPPKGTNMESMLGVSARLQASGAVHVVDLNDNPMARARLSALMAAVAIERTVGLETIPHVTPRDSSVMGLQSQLLGAHAEGIRNILAVTGDPPHVGDYPGSSGVYDVDAIGLTTLVSHLNRGEDFTGKAIDAPTSFYVGVAVNPSADDLDLEIERFRQKVDAGARFAMTQALFDLGYLDRFLERDRRPADPAARGHLAADQLPAGVPDPQRGARHHDPRGDPEAARRRGRGRAGGRVRAGARARRGIALARGRDLRDPAVQGARRGP